MEKLKIAALICIVAVSLTAGVLGWIAIYDAIKAVASNCR